MYLVFLLCICQLLLKLLDFEVEGRELLVSSLVVKKGL